VLVCCLPETLEGAEEFARWAQGLSSPKATHLVVVLPRQIGTLREAAAELRALRWVWDNTPALRDDRVARKELAERIAQLETEKQQLEQELAKTRFVVDVQAKLHALLEMLSESADTGNGSMK